MLARANIRKTKGQTVILILLFLISSMVLNVGLIVSQGFGSFFERTAEELNTSDTYIIIPEALYTDEAERYLSGEATVFQKNSGVLIAMTMVWKDEQVEFYNMICDKDEPRSLSKLKTVGEALPETPDAIYVPYRYKVVGGYNLGDGMAVEIDGQSFSFTVAGFIENIYQDNMYLGDTIFVPGGRYQELAETLPDNRKVLVFANGVGNYGKAESALLDITGATTVGYGGDMRTILSAIDYSSVKTNRTSMAAMLSVIMVVFTAVIAVVCLLVIRFRITGSVEEDMQKIGSLQSIGYTSRQITLSIMAQYGLIALIACFAGVFPAYLLLPAAGDVFALQSGLMWAPGFEPLLNLAAVGSLTLIVAAVAWVAAIKVRKISPVRALRGDIMAGSFKRNPVSLEKSRMPLTLSMSFKAVLQGLRQSVTVCVILTAVSFTAVVAAVLYYNSAIDLSTFEKVPGIERANAAITFTPGQDMEALRDEVSAHKDVRKAQYLDMGKAIVDSTPAGAMVMADYSGKETDNIYVGGFPSHDNEIAVSGPLAGMLNKGVGDEVALGSEGLAYQITGLAQGMESGSTLTVYLTLDGMRKLDPNFEQMSLMVYLNKGTDAAPFVLEMAEKYDGQIYQAIDADASFAEGVSSFASIISLVGLVILIIAGAVIILVLYFVIGSVIIRKRRELGIQKAVGYTTANLMNQISIGFAVPVILGAAAGCFLGAATMNPFMSVGMSQMGVMKANFIIDVGLVAIAGICIVVLSYLAGVLITWRIRKISAYALVT
jgi:putative ABC transport system permease protein